MHLGSSLFLEWPSLPLPPAPSAWSTGLLPDRKGGREHSFCPQMPPLGVARHGEGTMSPAHRCGKLHHPPSSWGTRLDSCGQGHHTGTIGSPRKMEGQRAPQHPGAGVRLPGCNARLVDSVPEPLPASFLSWVKWVQPRAHRNRPTGHASGGICPRQVALCLGAATSRVRGLGIQMSPVVVTLTCHGD